MTPPPWVTGILWKTDSSKYSLMDRTLLVVAGESVIDDHKQSAPEYVHDGGKTIERDRSSSSFCT